MRVFSLSTLRTFWEKHADAEQPLRAWFAEAERADWTGPQDIKNRYRTADFVPGDRVVFNVKGNKYRLIVAIKYDFGSSGFGMGTGGSTRARWSRTEAWP